MPPLGIDVGWFTRCSTKGCGQRIALVPCQAQATCWVCGTAQPVVPSPTPWPASIACTCGKMIPYGPGLPQVQCPWCGQLRSFARNVFRSGRPGGLSAGEAAVLVPLAASMGVHGLVSAGILVTCQGWRVWTDLDYTGSDDSDPEDPTGLVMYVETPALPRARMKRQGTIMRIGKSLGMVTDLELGEASFDDLVVLEPREDPAGVAAMLRAAPARECVKALLSHGASEVRTGQLVHHGMATLHWGQLVAGQPGGIEHEREASGPAIVAADLPLGLADVEPWRWLVHTLVTLASSLCASAAR